MCTKEWQFNFVPHVCYTAAFFPFVQEETDERKGTRQQVSGQKATFVNECEIFALYCVWFCVISADLSGPYVDLKVAVCDFVCSFAQNSVDTFPVTSP